MLTNIFMFFIYLYVQIYFLNSILIQKLHAMPNVQQTLLQFIDAVNPRLVDTLVDDTTDPVDPLD